MGAICSVYFRVKWEKDIWTYIVRSCLLNSVEIIANRLRNTYLIHGRRSGTIPYILVGCRQDFGRGDSTLEELKLFAIIPSRFLVHRIRWLSVPSSNRLPIIRIPSKKTKSHSISHSISPCSLVRQFQKVIKIQTHTIWTACNWMRCLGANYVK